MPPARRRAGFACQVQWSKTRGFLRGLGLFGIRNRRFARASANGSVASKAPAGPAAPLSGAIARFTRIPARFGFVWFLHTVLFRSAAGNGCAGSWSDGSK